MKNAGVKPEDLPLPLPEKKHGKMEISDEAARATFDRFEAPL